MIDLGEPLHAFDYDVLKERAGNKNIKIITRPAKEGEEAYHTGWQQAQTTSTNVLVCDEKGSLVPGGCDGRCGE